MADAGPTGGNNKLLCGAGSYGMEDPSEALSNGRGKMVWTGYAGTVWGLIPQVSRGSQIEDGGPHAWVDVFRPSGQLSVDGGDLTLDGGRW